MTDMTNEPQRPGVMDVHNDCILSDVKERKGTRRNPHWNWSGSKPRPT
jgi:hypothetical protein